MGDEQTQEKQETQETQEEIPQAVYWDGSDFSSYADTTLDGVNKAFGINIPLNQARHLLDHPNSFYRHFLTPVCKQLSSNNIINMLCKIEDITNDAFILIKKAYAFQHADASLKAQEATYEQQFADYNERLTSALEEHRNNEAEVMKLASKVNEWNQLQEKNAEKIIKKLIDANILLNETGDENE